MEQDFYLISYDTFNKWYKIAENTANNLSVIKTYCDYYDDSEDCIKIKSVIEYTHKEADLLYAEFIDLKYSS